MSAKSNMSIFEGAAGVEKSQLPLELVITVSDISDINEEEYSFGDLSRSDSGKQRESANNNSEDVAPNAQNSESDPEQFLFVQSDDKFESANDSSFENFRDINLEIDVINGDGIVEAEQEESEDVEVELLEDVVIRKTEDVNDIVKLYKAPKDQASEGVIPEADYSLESVFKAATMCPGDFSSIRAKVEKNEKADDKFEKLIRKYQAHSSTHGHSDSAFLKATEMLEKIMEKEEKRPRKYPLSKMLEDVNAHMAHFYQNLINFTKDNSETTSI